MNLRFESGRTNNSLQKFLTLPSTMLISKLKVQTAGVGPPPPLAPKNGRAAFLKKLDSDKTVMPRLLLGDGVSLFSTAFFRTSLRVTGPCLVLQIPGGHSRLSELSGYCISEALTTCGPGSEAFRGAGLVARSEETLLGLTGVPTHWKNVDRFNSSRRTIRGKPNSESILIEQISTLNFRWKYPFRGILTQKSGF